MRISYWYFGIISLFVFTFPNCLFSQNPAYLSEINQNLTSPVRLAIDNSNMLFVTDAARNVILKYDAAGNLVDTISPGGAPLSIAINAKNEIFYGDAETGSIYRLNYPGTPAVFYSGTLFPSSMIFIADSLYVVDSKLLHVIVLDKSGQVVRKIGIGTFIYPVGITFNPKNNRLLISEHGGLGGGFNPVVKVWMFGLAGNLIGSFGSHGNADGKFYRIQGMDVDRCGNIYIPDPFLGRISVFNENGTFITKFGIWGEGTGNLNIPLDITINSRDSIWVTSMNNSAVELYKINFSLPTSNIINADKAICAGDTAFIPVYLTGVAPWSLTYTIDNINPDTINNITESPYLITSAQRGTYRVTSITDSGGSGICFSGSATIAVDTLIPASVITSGDSTICSGDTAGITIDFSGTAPWTFTYIIDSENPATIDKISVDPYVLPAVQAGTYEIIALSGAGCQGTSFSGNSTITVNPLPASAITSGNTTICAGDSTGISIGFTGTAPYTFSYTLDNLNPKRISDIPSDTFTLYATEAGSYVITELSDANCPGTSFTGNAGISVNPVPSLNITSGNTTICSGSADITFDFTGNPPWNFTYTIDGLNPTSISNINSEPYILSVSQEGSYEVTALDAAGCNGTSFYGMAAITIDSTLPTSAITSGNVSFCQGDTVGISVDLSGISPWSLTYTIDNSNPQTINNITDSTYILSATLPGTYEITSISGAGCSGTAMTGNATLYRNSAYSVTETFSICEGSNYNFGAQTLSISGTYVETFSSVSGCDSIVNLNLDVKPLPVSNIPAGNLTICSGAAEIKVDLSGVPPWTLTYTTDSLNPAVISNINSNPYFLTVASAGEYEITSVADANCTGNYFTGVVIVTKDSTLPESAIISGNASICSGETSDISISLTGVPPWTLTYTIDSINPITVDNINSSPYILKTGEQGLYEVTSLSGGGCTGNNFSGSANIIVNPLPVSNITNGNSSIRICESDSENMAVVFTGAPPWNFTYNIDNSNPVSVNNISANPFNLPLSQTGTYEIIALSDANCSGTDFWGSFDLIVDSLPTASITSGNDTICEGDTSLISIEFTGAKPWNFIYTIDNQNPISLDSIVTTPYILPATLQGSYSISAVADDHCAGALITGTPEIIVNPVPSSNITSGNKTICSGSTDITFDFTGNPPWNFTYTIDSINPATINNITTEPYILTVSQGGAYEVIALDANGCNGTGFSGIAEITIDSTVPISNITTGNLVICDGDTADISIYLTGVAPWTFTYTIDGINPTTVNNVYDDPYTLSAFQAGIYEITALSGGGCIGTSFLGTANISSISNSAAAAAATICQGENYVFGSQTLTTGGTYNEIFTTSNGCDSVVTLTLTVNQSAAATAAATICQGENYVFGTQTLTASGTYNETFTASNGCDSVVALALTVNPTAAATAAATICQGENYTFGSQTLTTSGTYNETFAASNGCDSVVTLALTVDSLPDPSFTYLQNGLEINFINYSLYADSFFWGFGDGETSVAQNPVHQYPDTGTYVITLTVSNIICGDSTISDTINLVYISAGNIAIENILKIYPNPSTGQIILEINNPGKSSLYMEITDLAAQVIYSKNFKTQNAVESVNLSGFPNGIYTVKLISSNLFKIEKLILRE